MKPRFSSEAPRKRLPPPILILGLVSALLVGKAYAQEVEILIRTFIPKEHPSLPDWTIPVPGKPESRMLPDLGVGECFGTDDRSFSTDREVSTRFGGVITISPDSANPVTYSEIHGLTREYNCSSGAIVCEEISGRQGFRIRNVTRSGGVIRFKYAGEASNPCLLVAPDIEFEGEIVLDTANRTLSISGKNDRFPAFEALVIRGDRVLELFSMEPATEATPLDLVTSSAERPFSGVVNLGD